jgi:hypothetical protein
MRNNVSEPLDRACAGCVRPERTMRSHLVILVIVAYFARIRRKCSALKTRSNDQCTRAGPTRSSVQHVRSAKASGTKWAGPVIITDEIFGRRVRGDASVIWHASHSAVGFSPRFRRRELRDIARVTLRGTKNCRHLQLAPVEINAPHPGAVRANSRPHRSNGSTPAKPYLTCSKWVSAASA